MAKVTRIKASDTPSREAEAGEPTITRKKVVGKDKNVIVYSPITKEEYSKQKELIIQHLNRTAADLPDHDQKYFKCLTKYLSSDYIDDLVYCDNGHIIFGVWGLRLIDGKNLTTSATKATISTRTIRWKMLVAVWLKIDLPTKSKCFLWHNSHLCFCHITSPF